tara:strand:- start:1106 stop:1321 length:216 start_codon:yes stop_codon:yes gene_type:complete
MQIKDIKTPLSEMTDDQLEALQRDIRTRRMTTVKVEKKQKKARKEKAGKASAVMKNMSTEELKQLMEKLKG